MTGVAAGPELQPCIVLAGFGDVGQTYAAALKARGAAVCVFHPAPRAHALEAAARMGTSIETDPQAAYAGCDLVLNVAPGSRAVAVALAAAPHLKPGAIFADLSSAAPDDLRQAATYFPEGAYVDVAIMGAMSIHGLRTPLLASGAASDRLRGLLEPLGFSMKILPDSAPGDATAIKLVRSVLTKGMDAVVIECLLVAEALGLRDALLAQMGDLDSSPLSELMQMFVRTHAPHAVRRLHEVEATEKALENLGVPLFATAAARRRFARSIETLGAGARIPERPDGAPLYDRVLPWMLQAEKDKPL